MGAIQLPDELERVIERQVAEGRAASPTAFLEEAVRRLVDETRAEEDEVRQAAEAGAADIEAGRYTTVATPEDEQLLRQRLTARLQALPLTGNWPTGSLGRRKSISMPCFSTARERTASKRLAGTVD